MNEMHLSCSNDRARFAFFSFFFSQTRDFTTLMLHDLTDLYVERVTAPHYNKLSFMFS